MQSMKDQEFSLNQHHTHRKSPCSSTSRNGYPIQRRQGHAAQRTEVDHEHADTRIVKMDWDRNLVPTESATVNQKDGIKNAVPQ